MNKTMYALVMVLLIGMALYPLAVNQPGGKTRQMRQQDVHRQQVRLQDVNPVEREMTAKRAIVNQDVRITEQMCRSACMNEAGDELAAMQTINGQGAQKTLLQWRHKHPHVEYAAIGPVGMAKANAESAASGHLTPEVQTAVSPYLTAAKQTVAEGKHYLSPRITAAGKTHFVFGRVAPDGKRYMIGVVNQSFIDQVADHQTKNLRLKSFPAEKRWNVKTVDSDSLQPKTTLQPGQEEGASHYKTNEVVVKFRVHPTDAELARYHSDIGGKMTQKVGNIFIFKTDRLDATQLIRYFRDKNIVYVEPHFLYMTNEARMRAEYGGIYGPPYPPTASGAGTPAPSAPGGTAPPSGVNIGMNTFEPNDTLYMKYQWNLRQIGTESGWQANANNEVIVGIIDTGVDLSHPDLQGHLAKGLNIVTPDAPPDDDVGHGTHVAGVIAALTNNKMGVAGMTWGGRVLPVKALDSTGAGSTYAVAQGIIWATDHGAKVINMSLGNYADSNFLKDAIKYAYDRDVVLIAASGNDNTDRPSYPAYYPEVFAVAATDADNQRASFSNYGDYVDGAAPGVSIASTYPNHQYAALSGTSMASPHVAALAALIRSVNPSLRNTEVMDIMRKSAQDLGAPGPDYQYGSGLIDVSKAVQLAQQSMAQTSR